MMLGRRVSSFRPLEKITIVRGENIQRDKITLARSSSPYSRRITIRYESPKKQFVNNSYVSKNELSQRISTHL
jgi:hypothetical protein